jgi:hypothetical protein
VTAIPGVVFSGSVDGHLRAYSTASGDVLWDTDTAGEFKTVNGGVAHGGSMDVAGVAVVNGVVFANSGYNHRRADARQDVVGAEEGEMGGCPVLGYDVDPSGGRLVVNEEEAERVRAIFTWFAEHGSARKTLAEIERRGWRLKSWTRRTGQFRTKRARAETEFGPVLCWRNGISERMSNGYFGACEK